MDTLREWIYTLLICSAVGCVCVAVSPTPEMKKYLKLACSLVAAALVTAPVGKLVSQVGLIDAGYAAQAAAGTSGEIEQSRQWIIRQSSAQAEEALKGAISKKTGIKPLGVNIYIEQDPTLPGELAVTSAEVTLPEEGRARSDEIRLYAEYLLACPVKVGIGKTGDGGSS